MSTRLDSPRDGATTVAHPTAVLPARLGPNSHIVVFSVLEYAMRGLATARIGSLLTELIGALFAAHAALAQESIASIYFDAAPGVTAVSVEASSACELAPSAHELLAAIADRWREAGQPDFVIYGHDDQAGGKDLSLAISACRASRVFRAAQEYGVDPARMYLYAMGEARPAYDAGDGQPEPLNRRVEIEFYK